MSNRLASAPAERWSGEQMKKRVARRYAAERRFKLLGFSAVALSVAFLAFLLFTMASMVWGGFTHLVA
jgi:phosphate transport system permease protein